MNEEFQLYAMAYSSNRELGAQLVDRGLRANGWMLILDLCEENGGYKAVVLQNHAKKRAVLALAGTRFNFLTEEDNYRLHNNPADVQHCPVWETLRADLSIFLDKQPEILLRRAEAHYERVISSGKIKYPLEIYGHSLGGVLAQLVYLKKDTGSLKCHSCESPGIKSLIDKENIAISPAQKARLTIYRSCHDNVVNTYGKHLVSPKLRKQNAHTNSINTLYNFRSNFTSGSFSRAVLYELSELSDFSEFGISAQLASHSIESFIVPETGSSAELPDSERTVYESKLEKLESPSTQNHFARWRPAARVDICISDFPQSSSLESSRYENQFSLWSSDENKNSAAPLSFASEGGSTGATLQVIEGVNLFAAYNIVDNTVSAGVSVMLGEAAVITMMGGIAGAFIVYHAYKFYSHRKHKSYKKRLFKIIKDVRDEMLKECYVLNLLPISVVKELKPHLEKFMEAEIKYRDREYFISRNKVTPSGIFNIFNTMRVTINRVFGAHQSSKRKRNLYDKERKEAKQQMKKIIKDFVSTIKAKKDKYREDLVTPVLEQLRHDRIIHSSPHGAVLEQLRHDRIIHSSQPTDSSTESPDSERTVYESKSEKDENKQEGIVTSSSSSRNADTKQRIKNISNELSMGWHAKQFEAIIQRRKEIITEIKTHKRQYGLLRDLLAFVIGAGLAYLFSENDDWMFFSYISAISLSARLLCYGDSVLDNTIIRIKNIYISNFFLLNVLAVPSIMIGLETFSSDPNYPAIAPAALFMGCVAIAHASIAEALTCRIMDARTDNEVRLTGGEALYEGECRVGRPHYYGQPL